MSYRFLFTAAALIGSLPAQAPIQRSPDHPLPPTASTLVSTPPVLGPRAPSVAPTPVVAAARPAVPPSNRRSDRPADAVFDTRITNVLFDQPLADGSLWAMGENWKASFDGTGFSYVPFFGAEAPRNFPLRVELVGAAVGGEPLPLTHGAPVQQGFAVHTARGSLLEVVDLDLREVEQSFVFNTLPNRGAVRVDVRLGSELVGRATEQGIRFGNALGSVGYEKAVAIDAAGRRLPLSIEWNGEVASIEIPAEFVATAKLPLVLDPLLTSNLNVAPGALATQLQTDADVATIQSATGRSLVVWRRQFSAGDQDCWARVLDLDAVPVGAPFTIDFTFRDWRAPAVAGSFNGQNFLVASEVREGAVHYIAGRMVSAAGVASPVFDIERDGVVGLPGNNFRPDVGSDPFPSTAAYFCVVFEKTVGPGNNDIYFKLVRQDGTLLTPNPTALDTDTNNQSNPTISKSNAEALWFVAWQTTWPLPPFDQELSGAFVNWPGTITTPEFQIAATADEESAPATSSPFQVPGVNDPVHAIAFERAPTLGAQRDIFVRLYDTAGVQVGPDLNLSQDEGAFSAPWDQQAPDIDSDGVRLVVGYTEPFAGNQDLETRVTTVAFTNGAFRLDEVREPLGVSINNEVGTRICAQSSGGPNYSSRYVVVGHNTGTNDVEAYVYGGYSPGSFFSVFSSACGASNPTITASGSTAIGETATLTVNATAPAGTLFGLPTFQSLLPICNCVLGVDILVASGSPLVITVPRNPALVGQVFSVQGYALSGATCLGLVDLTDTIDLTVR